MISPIFLQQLQHVPNYSDEYLGFVAMDPSSDVQSARLYIMHWCSGSSSAGHWKQQFSASTNWKNFEDSNWKS